MWSTTMKTDKPEARGGWCLGVGRILPRRDALPMRGSNLGGLPLYPPAAATDHDVSGVQPAIGRTPDEEEAPQVVADAPQATPDAPTPAPEPAQDADGANSVDPLPAADDPRANSGTDGVEPEPAFGLCDCSLRSETVATSPVNRSRTVIGVGERVKITTSRTPVRWSAAGAGTVSASTPSTATLVAGENGGTVTVTASVDFSILGRTLTTCTCSKTFTVVPPTDIRMAIISNARHIQNRPTCGFLTRVFVLPDTVSFQNISVREQDDQGVGSGFYAPFNTRWHRGVLVNAGASPAASVNAPSGPGVASAMTGGDEVWSGDPGGLPAAGSLTFPSRWEYQVGTTWLPLVHTVQTHTTRADGSCTTSKAGASAMSALADPTSPY